MARFPWFAFYSHDWLASQAISAMTSAQEGSYIRLLAYCWTDRACTLPVNKQELKRMARWTGTDDDFEVVRRCFHKHPNEENKLTNLRLYAEWHKANGLSQMNKNNAKKRWANRPNGPTPPIPLTPKIQDRTTKGLQSISDDVRTVADKWFPPQ